MIVMYGASPMPESPRFPKSDVSPEQAEKIRRALEEAMIAPVKVELLPGAPEPIDAIARRLTTRIAWLKRELSMHDAWRVELALLERMLSAMVGTVTDEKGTNR